jgi:hypothetical protein
VRLEQRLHGYGRIKRNWHWIERASARALQQTLAQVLAPSANCQMQCVSTNGNA